MAYITLKNVIDDGRTLLQNHSRLHHITDIWRKINTTNAARSINSSALITRPGSSIINHPLKGLTVLISGVCLQIAAAIVSLMPRLPFNLPTAVTPKTFYLVQWKADANSLDGLLNRLIYCMARIPDAIHLVWLFGPLSQHARKKLTQTTACSCSNNDDQSTGCRCHNQL